MSDALERARQRVKQGVPIDWEDADELVRHVYALRADLAFEADVLEAHLTYKTFPKTRRRFAEKQVERLRAMALGQPPEYDRDEFGRAKSLHRLHAITYLDRPQTTDTQCGPVVAPDSKVGKS